MGLPHPFFPTDIELPHYAVSSRPLHHDLAIFLSALVLVVVVASVLSSIARAAAASATSAAPWQLVPPDWRVVWWSLNGSIHCFFEGYFVWNHKHIAADTSVIASVWKEYALSDSRYMTADPFLISVESITATLIGPLCFLQAYLTLRSRPAQYPLTLIISVLHIFSCTLYYATTFFEGHGQAPHCKPGWLYLGFYFLFLNAFWILIPAFLIRQDVGRIMRALRAVE
ncbi:Emopamil-binding protein [Polychytrium aggregatum]|uniref:Emopamil-binding protein n=1 Tax=Polychytrium aggregatum TaxID=110093 RepID=UPI0022FEBC74|nr:Emopamil-binding protein [Polychytrium aggregatum]KAI9193134.1 Emopamil-binding protein [Polychytrium aggregatum]